MNAVTGILSWLTLSTMDRSSNHNSETFCGCRCLNPGPFCSFPPPFCVAENDIGDLFAGKGEFSGMGVFGVLNGEENNSQSEQKGEE